MPESIVRKPKRVVEIDDLPTLADQRFGVFSEEFLRRLGEYCRERDELLDRLGRSTLPKKVVRELVEKHKLREALQRNPE